MAASGGSDVTTALVHEWIDAYAGSEQVFEAIARVFPRADLYALTVKRPDIIDSSGRMIRTTFLDVKSLRNRRELSLPLMPLAWRALGKRKYDLVVSSHHAFAHSNRLSSEVHLSYVHSPARYLWSSEIDGRGDGWHLSAVRAALRGVDRRASKRVTAYAANSSTVAARIRKFWNRDAVVIYPPVRTEYFSQMPADGPPDQRSFVLGFGRWVPYKNMTLVIDAAEAAGLPVVIAGRGPEEQRIRERAITAKVPVKIVKSPTDSELRTLYRSAACLVFPTIEDFGIIPVEAQAAGCPVVSIREGGATDTVVDGVTGVLTDSLSVRELAEGIARATLLSDAHCVMNASRFSVNEFEDKLLSWVRSFGG